MKQGQIKFFNETKSFGFIVPEEGGKDIFVHKTGLEDGYIPKQGDSVEFDTEEGRGNKGPQAIRVRLAE